jgi:hypothetical protein
MKKLQDYIFAMNRVYEYRVKIAGVNPKGAVMERIKNALDVYEVETISTARSIPIQEHRDFPKMGPCEAWVFEVSVRYPTTTSLLRQMIRERAGVNPECVCVYTKDEDDNNECAENLDKDVTGARLLDPDLKAEVGGQEIVGQARADSMLKELTKGKAPGIETRPAAQKAQPPADTKSPVGSTQNKIPSPFKGKK